MGTTFTSSPEECCGPTVPRIPSPPPQIPQHAFCPVFFFPFPSRFPWFPHGLCQWSALSQRELLATDRQTHKEAAGKAGAADVEGRMQSTECVPPKAMVSGGGVHGRQLGIGDRALLTGAGDLVREARGSSFTPPPAEDTVRRQRPHWASNLSGPRLEPHTLPNVGSFCCSHGVFRGSWECVL